MGNKLSCSCAPLIKKAYKYEDQIPFRPRREGRLWAEVFHVSAASGAVRWQQVSEDLVPVNITCIQDTPDFIFKITAYNSQVDRILDVTIHQPGTRLGQASECFVYWKDTSTGDTWGLNFTSPLDAKQFRDLCSSPNFKISRKASSSYSLREDPRRRDKIRDQNQDYNARNNANNANTSRSRKPPSQSTPSSPSRRDQIRHQGTSGAATRTGGGTNYGAEELQCTCMTAETLHRQRNGRVRYTATSTLPKTVLRQDSSGSHQSSSAAAQGHSRSGQVTGYNAPGQTVSVTAAQRQLQQSRSGAAAAAAAATSAAAGVNRPGSNRPAAQYSRSQFQSAVRSKDNSNFSRSMDSQASSSNTALYRQQHQQQLLQHAQSLAGRHIDPRSAAMSSSNQDNKSRSKSSDDVRRTIAVGTDDLQSDLKKLATLGHHPQEYIGHRQSYPASAYAGHQGSGHQPRKGAGPNQVSTITLGQPRPSSRGGTSGPVRPTSVPAWSCYANNNINSSGESSQLQPISMCHHPSEQKQQQMQPGGASAAANPNASSNSAAVHTSHAHSQIAVDRSRIYRSEIGRRRSLERAQGFDFQSIDLSPSSDPYLHPHLHQPHAHFKGGDLTGSNSQLASATTSRGQVKHQTSDLSGNSNVRVTPTPSSSGDEQQQQLLQLQQLQAQGQQVLGGIRGRSKSALGVPGHGRSSPTIKVLQEYEQHLRNALAKGTDAEDSYSLNTFETILSQSMENVVTLMREVQSEIEAIRREESHYQSHRSPIFDPESDFMSLHHPRSQSSHGHRSTATPYSRSNTLPSRGTSLPPPSFLGSSTGDLYHSIRKSSAPILDTLSVDGHRFGHLRTQSSFESTGSDYKAYLTSSEMSDDERLSLTTAISDDDDGENRDSPYRAKSGAAAAAFQCTGAVRKAGFLSVKKWILRKRNQIKLARKRGWKGYWVCLKGTTLLFYPCDSRDGRAIENTPRHLIIIDGSVVQPIPEHPKRDFIFCLSTAFGDAYLFQAPCQVELDNWIGAIHNACGAAFARHRGKSGALTLLGDEIIRLDRQVELDSRLKQMADLQLTVVSDPESRKALVDQIRSHEESLEQNHCEIFRLRCYSSSIQGTELPNPKTLLAHVSKVTKLILNRLGVFTVSSFHTFICARSPSMLTNVISGRGNASRKKTINGSVDGSNKRSFELSGDKLIKITIPGEDNVSTICVKGTETVDEVLWAILSDRQLSATDYYLRLVRSNGDPIIPLRSEIIDHFPPHDMMEIAPKILYQVELTRLNVDQLFGFSVEAELVESSLSDHQNQDELCVYVSRVEELSLASNCGLAKGDEIMVINGAIISDLDMMYIESVLQEELSLCMMLRSNRSEAPEMSAIVRSTEEYIESLVCPPPPTDGAISDDMIGKLIVPSPHWTQDRPESRAAAKAAAASTRIPTIVSATVSGDQIAENLLKTAEQVTADYCGIRPDSRTDNVNKNQTKVMMSRSRNQTKAMSLPPRTNSNDSYTTQVTNVTVHAPPAMVSHHSSHKKLISQPSMDEGSTASSSNRRMSISDAERLRKVIHEIVDTERAYVENLGNLVEIYLEPLLQQQLVSLDDLSDLYNSTLEISAFQRLFLRSLEEGICEEGKYLDSFETTSQFKPLLFAIGNCFQKHSETFKLYSSFCSAHAVATKTLFGPGSKSANNPSLSEFLTRQSQGQHAYSLESYLIKPIQRILKYPLLLQQLKLLTKSRSEEHRHLAQALKQMEKVAQHINDMQRTSDDKSKPAITSSSNATASTSATTTTASSSRKSSTASGATTVISANTGNNNNGASGATGPSAATTPDDFPSPPPPEAGVEVEEVKQEAKSDKKDKKDKKKEKEEKKDKEDKKEEVSKSPKKKEKEDKKHKKKK